MLLKSMLRRVHANLGHPSKGLMLRLLRDANAPLEMIAAARIFPCTQCDLNDSTNRSSPTCASFS